MALPTVCPHNKIKRREDGAWRCTVCGQPFRKTVEKMKMPEDAKTLEVDTNLRRLVRELLTPRLDEVLETFPAAHAMIGLLIPVTRDAGGWVVLSTDRVTCARGLQVWVDETLREAVGLKKEGRSG